jgi:DNA transformation protein and related proteins
MATSAEFLEFLSEQLSALGAVRTKRMFGGAGIYAGELMFGLIIEETLYLKADDLNRPRFEEAGMEPFRYDTKNGKQTVMSYWRCPDALYDEPDEMLDWARTAVAAAGRTLKTKTKAPAKRKAAPK